MPVDNPRKMTVADLRKELKTRGLDTSGLKNELVERLTAAMDEGEDEEVEEKKAAPKKAPAKRGRKAAEEEEEEEEEEEKPAKKAAPKKAPAKRGRKVVEEEEEEEEKEGKEEDDEDHEKPSAKARKLDVTTKKGVGAKVDQHCPIKGEVYVDGSDVYDVMLNQTNIAQNNNKYYVIQLVQSGNTYYAWNRWGRVGEARAGATKLDCGPSLAAAKKSFEKKFKDKTGNNWADRANFKEKSGKYTLIEMSYSDDEEEEEVQTNTVRKQPKVRPCNLPKNLQDVLKLIFDQDMFKQALVSFNIDVKKMPLGKISKGQLNKGFAILEEMKEILDEGSHKGLVELTSKFYTAIPHDFGRKVPPVLNTAEAVQQKMDLLEVLGDIVIAQDMLKENKGEIPDEIDHPIDVNYKKLKNNIVPLDRKSEEWKIIETYTNNTVGYRKCKILDIFKVDREGEKDRFTAFKNLDNRRLLWHGTNVAVVAAILTGGLRIMPHSGGRVGRGLYFASENAKSAGYVGTTNEGNKQVGFMFLNEVALGKEHHITQDDSSLRAAPKGTNCVIAKGRVEPDPKYDVKIKGDFGDIVVPQGKAIDMPQYKNSSFFNSEYLVYDEGQVYMRYMLKCEFSY